MSSSLTRAKRGTPKQTNAQTSKDVPRQPLREGMLARFLPGRRYRSVSVMPVEESQDSCTVSVSGRNASVYDLRQTISNGWDVPEQLIEITKNGYEVGDEDPIKNAWEDDPVTFDIIMDRYRDLIKHLGDLPLDNSEKVQFMTEEYRGQNLKSGGMPYSLATGCQAYALKVKMGDCHGIDASSRRKNKVITYTAVTDRNVARIVNKGYMPKDNTARKGMIEGIHSTPHFEFARTLGKVTKFDDFECKILLANYVDPRQSSIVENRPDRLLLFHRDVSSLFPFALLIWTL